MDVAEVDKVGIGDSGDCEDEIIQKLPSKNLNKTTGYLILDARQAFI